MNRLHRDEVSFERKRPVGHAAEAGLGLVAVGMEPIAQDKSPRIDVEVADGRFGVANPRPQARHPGETVAAPRLRAFAVPVLETGGNDPLVALAVIGGDQVEGMKRHQV